MCTYNKTIIDTTLAFGSALLVTLLIMVVLSFLIDHAWFETISLVHRLSSVGIIFGLAFGVLLRKWWAGSVTFVFILVPIWVMMTFWDEPLRCFLYLPYYTDIGSFLCDTGNQTKYLVDDFDQGIFWLSILAVLGSTIAGILSYRSSYRK
jgi:hypothetical protein